MHDYDNEQHKIKIRLTTIITKNKKLKKNKKN